MKLVLSGGAAGAASAGVVELGAEMAGGTSVGWGVRRDD